MLAREKLIEYIKNMDEVKRFRELEKGINSNNKYQDALNKIKQHQKRMIMARTNNDIVKYQMLEEEYSQLLIQFNNLPFLEEYLELVEFINNMLQEIKQIFDDGLKLE